MKFVGDGPNIPESLLRAHEEGRVVFFCGAGISYPAGLPGFKGLVEQIYSKVGTTLNDLEQQVFDKDQFDATLDLLERRLPGQRIAVRRALMEVLEPHLRKKGASETHSSLLRLASTKEGTVRLVTTNFDRIFQKIMDRAKPRIPSYPAPLLPIPKNSRWNGVVYLHGLLPESFDESMLNRLVVTSGDFGLAYLIERWAARFVSELFRNYIVCFVGYSINDPVLRYMMDALAADQMLGEMSPQAYAFGDYRFGNESAKKLEWEAKGVVPILYEVPVGSYDHSALHRTIKAWSDVYHSGVRGKEQIVSECSISMPMSSTKQDDFVGRLMWALSDPCGLPAKRFANLDPVPSLDWLEPFCDERYGDSDLALFGVPIANGCSPGISFSLTCRPTPYSLAPLMSLAHNGRYDARWDDVMRYLSHWLIRHLDDPRLLFWVIKRGGCLHSDMHWAIERRLEDLHKLAGNSGSEELARIRVNAPNAIPRPPMHTLWRIVLTRRIKSARRDHELFEWFDNLKRYGLTASLRMQFRELLTPCVLLQEPSSWKSETKPGGIASKITDVAAWEVTLPCDHVHSHLSNQTGNRSWATALPLLLDDLGRLLKDALDLMRELDGANDISDLSYIYYPSITNHPQNNDFRNWTALIELTRDAWLAMCQGNASYASAVAAEWSRIKYPVFRRLAFFAAAHDGLIDTGCALDWLLSDDCWWLWSNETKREALRLVIKIGPELDSKQRSRLERYILRGPPRKMYKDDISAAKWRRIVAGDIWLRLSKLASSGVVLGKRSAKKLSQISSQNPEWKLAEDDRDEFPFWMGGLEPSQSLILAPRRRRDLVAWLQKTQNSESGQEDDWKKRCQENFSTAACALYDLSEKGIWPVERWRQALEAWSSNFYARRAWRYISPILSRAPDTFISTVRHAISWWLHSNAKVFKASESEFLSICNRILSHQDTQAVSDEDPVGRAFNSSFGLTTWALLDWFFSQAPEDDQELPESLKSVFTQICKTELGNFHDGIILLSAYAIPLFRVDKKWTSSNLIPLFSWGRSEAFASQVWSGYLASPRLFRPLLELLKPYFLESAAHYEMLGERGKLHASLLTIAALDPGDTFTSSELNSALEILPPKGLIESAEALVRALEGAGDKRAEYWKLRVVPFLKKIWPNSRQRISEGISEKFALLCIAAGEHFSDAVYMLQSWFIPVAHFDYLVHRLSDSNLPSKFPEAATILLAGVVDKNHLWLSDDLEKCIRSIIKSEPAKQNDGRIVDLVLYLRRRGQWETNDD